MKNFLLITDNGFNKNIKKTLHFNDGQKRFIPLQLI